MSWPLVKIFFHIIAAAFYMMAGYTFSKAYRDYIIPLVIAFIFTLIGDWL